jgi:hypothetical protein
MLHGHSVGPEVAGLSNSCASPQRIGATVFASRSLSGRHGLCVLTALAESCSTWAISVGRWAATMRGIAPSS